MVMKWIGLLKSYGLAILSGLVVILGFLLKLSGSRLKRQKQQLETAEAKIHRARVIAEADNELEAEYRSHRAEVKNEIESNNYAPNLDDNDWVRKPDDKP